MFAPEALERIYTSEKKRDESVMQGYEIKSMQEIVNDATQSAMEQLENAEKQRKEDKPTSEHEQMILYKPRKHRGKTTKEQIEEKQRKEQEEIDKLRNDTTKVIKNTPTPPADIVRKHKQIELAMAETVKDDEEYQ